MDKKKALFRAKLNQKLKQNRINDPLVRYNENDKPVCRVCEIVLKSESDWQAHHNSRKHREAINNYKTKASEKNAVSNAKSESSKVLTKHQGDSFHTCNDDKTSTSVEVKKSRPSSALPANFFDNQEAKKQKVGSAQVEQIDASLGAVSRKPGSASQTQPVRIAENGITSSGTKQPKGALPEGFFDNKDADLRARGIEPVKPDVKDEYKEFEKLIQVDLAQVDNRFEEEEIDAAEQIEEEEIIEQRTYRDRVEELKRKKKELVAAKSSTASKEISDLKSDEQDDESSSEDEDEENFTVDWRAQHL